MIDYSKDVLPILKQMSSEHLLHMACDIHSKAQHFEAQGMKLIAMEARRICADIEIIIEERKHTEGKAA